MTFQAKLTTKLEKYSVDNTIVELTNTITKDSLNNTIKSLLVHQDKFIDEDLANKTFEFLVGGKLLRLNVEEHLKLYSDEIDANELLSEKLVDVEYTLSLEPPKPLEAIPHGDWVSCVDANESFIISGSYDCSVRLFSIKDRANILTIQNAHERPISKVKFLTIKGQNKKNELYFVSCGHDEVSILRRLNTKTHKVDIVYVYRGHNRSVNCVDICDDLIATGSFDKTLRIWSTDENHEAGDGIDENDPGAGEVKSNKKQKTKSSEKSIAKTYRSAVMTLTGHQESVTGVRFLRNCNEYNSIATCSMDKAICIWDIEVGECKSRMNSAKPLLGIDFCEERNLIISASCDRHVRLWDARGPENASAKAAFTSHSAWVSSVAFGPRESNHFISGGYDNLVKLWDLRSPKACLYDLIGHHDKVLDVNWQNSSYVFSGSADATLKVFATGRSMD